MTEEVKEGTTEGADGSAEQINWQERAEIAEKGLMKRDAKFKELEGEVKKLKAGRKPESESDGQDYKTLYQQETAARTKLVERTRKSDVSTAATARLTKVGVDPEALDAALQLIDSSKVEWDEDGGVDETSVNAAVATLKTKFPVLFGKKIPANNPKVAGEGKTSDPKTITRAEFEALDYRAQSAKMLSGFKVV